MCTVRFLVALAAASIGIRAFALQPDQVYAKVAPSIVVVWGYSTAAPKDISFGSGVIIAPGQIVTNCHVVQGADVIYLNRENITTLGIIRYADPDRDLCQIGATEINGFEQAVSHITSTEGLRIGQKVYAVGAPQGLELTLSDGLISSLRTLPIGTIIQTNTPISQGSSGGGLFDSNGRLIGITSFVFKSGQNLNFAVPASWISELPNRHKLREDAARKEIEEVAAFQARADEEQRREDEAKREEERKQRDAEETKRRAEAAARSPQEKLIYDWKMRIQARIKNRIVVPPNMEGNPEARFEVVLLPGGEVLSVVLRKSSGIPAYDAEVKRAIMAAQPLPVPSESDLFQENFRELTLVFRPKDSEGTPAYSALYSNRSAAPDESHENRLLVTYGQSISKEIRRYQKYPLSARQRSWEGTAEVLLQIAADGKVTGITLGKSSGHTILDEEALNMVRRASPLPQAPPDLRGRALVVSIPIVFGLVNAEPPPQ